MEDWQKILEGRYRNVQDFGEYIGLEIIKYDEMEPHPFNSPHEFGKKLESAGYKIKAKDAAVIYTSTPHYIRVEFWKREYVERAERLERTEWNYSDQKYGTIDLLSGAFDDPPLITSGMAKALLKMLRGRRDQLDMQILLLEDRITDNHFPDELERMPPAYWEHPETLDILK